MIYILTLTKLCPGEPTGYISDLWEDCWTDRVAAERAFNKMPLGNVYFRKELWVKEPGGRRKLVMEERYVAQRTVWKPDDGKSYKF